MVESLPNLVRSAGLLSSLDFVISGVRDDSLALEKRFEEVCMPLLPPGLDTIVILGWH